MPSTGTPASVKKQAKRPVRQQTSPVKTGNTPLKATLTNGRGNVNVTYQNDAGNVGWVWTEPAVDGISKGGVQRTNSSSDLVSRGFSPSSVAALKKQKRTAAALRTLAQGKNLEKGVTLTERRTALPGDGVTERTLFPDSERKEQQQVSQALSASTTDGSKSATNPRVLKLAATPPPPAPAPAPASAPPAMRTVTVDTPPIKQAANASKAAEQLESKEGEDDDDVSSQLGIPLPETGKKEKTPDRRNASIQTGVGQQALQQQNQPSPLAQENAAPTGFQGAAPAPPMRSASGPSNVIHKVAVQRISAAKGIPFETYRQAYMQSNGAEVESMSDNELYQSSVDLCDQGIDTVKIKKPRFTSGRANLVREFIELNVLYNMAKPKEAEQGSKLAMLLDASNMGISAEHMMQALKGSVGGGADGHIKQNAAVDPATLASTGPPAGSARADAAFTMGDTPNALNVKNTASYTSTTMHGKRIEKEFIMDRLRFDNNFSQDRPVTETTFHFKKKKPESRKLIRF